MRSLSLIAAAALLLFPPAFAGTADDIIAKHVAARGGAEAMGALQSLERTGRLVLPGFDARIGAREVRARPGMLRFEFTLQGLTQVQAWDGREGWQISPFQGRKDPERMPPDDAKGLAIGADLDGPLVGYAAKGHTAEYLGMEDVDGTPAHKIRVTLKGGDEITYFIDPDTLMIIRDVQKQVVRGVEQLVETDYGEYEKVAGVWVPMTEEQGAVGSDASAKQKLVYERAVANGPAPASLFAFPAAQPAGSK